MIVLQLYFFFISCLLKVNKNFKFLCFEQTNVTFPRLILSLKSSLAECRIDSSENFQKKWNLFQTSFFGWKQSGDKHQTLFLMKVFPLHVYFLSLLESYHMFRPWNGAEPIRVYPGFALSRPGCAPVTPWPLERTEWKLMDGSSNRCLRVSVCFYNRFLPFEGELFVTVSQILHLLLIYFFWSSYWITKRRENFTGFWGNFSSKLTLASFARQSLIIQSVFTQKRFLFYALLSICFYFMVTFLFSQLDVLYGVQVKGHCWPEPHRARLWPAEADTGWWYPNPRWPGTTGCSFCGRVYALLHNNNVRHHCQATFTQGMWHMLLKNTRS